MTGEQIYNRREKLKQELKVALSEMVLSTKIYEVRAEMETLKQQCPHFDAKLNFVMVDNICPYCGGKID